MKNKSIFLLTVIAILVIISSLGKSLYSPFDFSTPISGTVDSSDSAEGHVIIDNYGKRLMFLNNEEKLVAVKETNFLTNNYSTYQKCVISGDNVYVNKCNFAGYTNFVDNEEFILFDKSGHELKQIYEYKYDDRNKAANQNRVLGLQSLSDNNAVLSIYDRNRDVISIIKLMPDGNSLIYEINNIGNHPREAIYNEERNEVIIADFNGNFFLGKSDGTMKQLPSSNMIIYNISWHNDYIMGIGVFDDYYYLSKIDDLQNWHKINNNNDLYRYVQDIPTNHTYSYGYWNILLKSDDNNNFQEISDISYSKEFYLGILAVWLSILYLVILVLFVLYKKLAWKDIAKVINKAVAPVTIILITGYFAYNSYSVVVNSIGNELKNESAILENIFVQNKSLELDSYIKEAIKNIHELQSDPYRQSQAIHSKLYAAEGLSQQELQIGEEFNKISTFIYKYTKSKSNAESSEEVTISYKDHDGIWRIYADSVFKYMPCSYNGIIEENEANGEDELILNLELSKGGKYINYVKMVKDDNGEVIGAICMASRVDMIIYKHIQQWLTMIISLIMAGIIIYFLMVQFSEIGNSRRIYKKYISEKLEHIELAWYRQFTLLSTIIFGADNFVIVLIAKDILDSSGNDYSIGLLSMPFIAISMATFFSTGIYAYLQNKIKFRYLLIGASAWTLCWTVVVFWMADMKLFWGFVICKSLMTLGAGILNNACYIMPLKYESETDRAEGTQGLALIKIAGAAIGASICGYVSEYIGNGYVYLSLSVPVIIFLLMSWIFVPKAMYYGESRNGNSGMDNMKKMLSASLKPQMLILFIGIVLPIEIFTSYGKFMFPIFGTEAGLSKAAINNFVVVTNSIVFILRDVLKKASSGMDYWNSLIIFTVGFGLLYACFILNTSFIWAVLALLFINCLDRITSPSINIMWQRYVADKNISIVEYNNVFAYISNVLRIFPMPIAGFFLSFGITVCSIAFLVMGILGAVGFRAVSKNSVMRKAKA